MLDFWHGVSISGRRNSPYRGRDLEQFGTERQARVLSCSYVDLEANSVSFCNKLDHPAAAGELWHVTDCQDTGVAKFRENLLEAVLLRRIDE